MNVRTSPKVGYSTSEITQAPNWHGLVAWDLLLNNLTTGLFLVAAVGELLRPAAFAPLGRAVYPIALLLLLVDLACLVLDLGNPLKFHHMLRVFKPTSPMSLGTWCLTAYSLPLTVLAVVDLAVVVHLIPEKSTVLHLIRPACLIGGLIPALGSAVYKGVLFSTSSQPGWKNARWLGGYLVNSAFLLGAAELLVIARAMDQRAAVILLQPSLLILLFIHVIPLVLLIGELREAFERTRLRDRMIPIVAIVFGLGLVVPIALTVATTGFFAVIVVLGSLLAGGFLIRWTIVMIPHLID